jgi:hypothetical protein
MQTTVGISATPSGKRRQLFHFAETVTAESEAAIRTRPDPALHVGITLQDRRLWKGDFEVALTSLKQGRV